MKKDNENRLGYNARTVEEAFQILVNLKVPIRKGCKNKQCFCTGECNEIIGFRDKLPNEN